MIHTVAKITMSLAFAAGLSLPAAAQTLEPFNFTLPWLPVGDYAYYSAGVQKGFYKDEGIDFKINRGFGSIDVVTKLASGAFTAGEADIAAIISGYVKQQTPVRCIAANQTLSPHALLVLDNVGINSLKDLEGKTVATQPGNAMLLYFPLIAKANGIDAAKVNVTNVEAASMAGLLLQGKVDAAAFFATNVDFINRQASTVGKSVKALRYADYGLRIYGQCLAATETMIKEKPELLKRFVRATFKARLFAVQNPEETVDLHVKQFPEVNPKDALLSLKAALPYMFNENTTADGLGKFNMERLKVTYETVTMSQGLDTTGDATKVIDTSVMPN
jgi:NitT/TauT family transport system substrate-binding protein